MKTVVIIGASGGIGNEICKAFYKKGYNIFASYCNNKKAIDALCGNLNYKDNRICQFYLNLKDQLSIDKFFNKAISIFGKIDVLINCAGVSFPNLLIDCNLNEIENEIDINLKSVILCCKHAVTHMIKFSGGKIINIGSIWGTVGGSYESTYSATKAGVIIFSKALAKEVGSSNITVNCISPGAIKTNMISNLIKEDVQEIINNTPLKKLATAKQIAKTAIFLASNNANSITGQNIVIDGGFTL